MSGLASEAMHRRLLGEDTLTLKKAVEIAVGMEAAAKTAQAFKTPQNTVAKVDSDIRSCQHCGRKNHPSRDCRWRTATCHTCGKAGHISPICPTLRKKPRTQYPVRNCNISSAYTTTGDGEEPEELTEDGVEELGLYNIHDNEAPRPMVLEVEVEGRQVPMEIDTGAAVTIMSKDTWQRMFATLPLSKSQIALKTYTLKKMKVSGQRAVQVRYKGQVRQLRLIVVEGNGPTLLGRNWLKYLKLDWPQILHVAAAHMASCQSLHAVDPWMASM